MVSEAPAPIQSDLPGVIAGLLVQTVSTVTGGERLPLPVETPLAREHVHVQALCDATLILPDGSTEEGMGILEQLAIGPHPSGLVGILDGYAPTS